MLLINCPDGKEISIYFIRVWRGCGSLLKANFSIKYAFAKKGTQISLKVYPNRLLDVTMIQ